jgi:hypothetical protein
MLCFQQLKALAIASVTIFGRVTSRPGYLSHPEDEDEDEDRDTDQDDTDDNDGVLILLFRFFEMFPAWASPNQKSQIQHMIPPAAEYFGVFQQSVPKKDKKKKRKKEAGSILSCAFAFTFAFVVRCSSS